MGDECHLTFYYETSVAKDFEINQDVDSALLCTNEKIDSFIMAHLH